MDKFFKVGKSLPEHRGAVFGNNNLDAVNSLNGFLTVPAFDYLYSGRNHIHDFVPIALGNKNFKLLVLGVDMGSHQFGNLVSAKSFNPKQCKPQIFLNGGGKCGIAFSPSGISAKEKSDNGKSNANTEPVAKTVSVFTLEKIKPVENEHGAYPYWSGLFTAIVLSLIMYKLFRFCQAIIKFKVNK